MAPKITALLVTTDYGKSCHADPVSESIDVCTVHVTFHTGMARVVKFYYYIMGNI